MLGQEDPLEKGMATHSSILVWRIPWTEKPGGLHSPWGSQRVGHNRAVNTSTFKIRKSEAIPQDCKRQLLKRLLWTQVSTLVT